MTYEEIVKLLEEQRNYFLVDISLPGRHSGNIWARRTLSPINTPNQIEEAANWLFKHQNGSVRQLYVIDNQLFHSTDRIPEWLIPTVINFANSGEKELSYAFW